MDIWGYCEGCDVWFECLTDHTAAWACPSCGMEPLRIENRSALKVPRAMDVPRAMVSQAKNVRSDQS